MERIDAWAVERTLRVDDTMNDYVDKCTIESMIERLYSMNEDENGVMGQRLPRLLFPCIFSSHSVVHVFNTLCFRLISTVISESAHRRKANMYMKQGRMNE